MIKNYILYSATNTSSHDEKAAPGKRHDEKTGSPLNSISDNKVSHTVVNLLTHKIFQNIINLK